VLNGAVLSAERRPRSVGPSHSRGYAYRYIHSSTVVSALHQYHTPITHPPTPICIHQVAHVHEVHSRPEQAPLPITSTILCFCPYPHPFWLRRDDVERRRRGITNSTPRAKSSISERSFTCSESKLYHYATLSLLSEDTQPITAHSALSPPLIILNAAGRDILSLVTI